MCKDELVEEIVSTIERTAHTGLHGDGKIYVCDIKDAIRISTGDRGEKAV
jgi:nitrogen regulatory protein PII